MVKYYRLKKLPVITLKKVSVDFPLGKLIGVTGVSGSGKSSLITETLYPILNHHFLGQKTSAAL
jgi:excinuclease ABC subunit A